MSRKWRALHVGRAIFTSVYNINEKRSMSSEKR